MTVLFDRAIRLVIMTCMESYTITDLHIDFDIDTSKDSKSLNSATITIYNLSEMTRKNIEENYIALEFFAGYAGNPTLLFAGRITDVRNEKTGADWKTILSALDGGKEYLDRYYSKSWSTGTPIQMILMDVVNSLGLPFDMLPTLIPMAQALYTGVTYCGKSREILDEICKTHGLQWSIQRGIVEVTSKDFPLISALAQIVLLSADTGLIGYPVPVKEDSAESKDKDGNAVPIGKISFTSLLNPNIRPNRVVKFMPTFPTNIVGIRMLENKKGEKYAGQTYGLTTKGLFVVDRAKYTGSNYDQSFYVDGECKVL